MKYKNKSRGASNYVLVRDILGNEVYMNKRTGKEYLAVWSKKGKPRLVKL